MAEQQAVKTKRELMGERLKAKYPDREFADDEAMYSQINDDYDQYDQTVNGYKDREQKLVGMFRKDPGSAQFISDMARGEDPWLGLVKRVGKDGLTAIMEDPAKQKEFAKANQEFAERVAKEDKLEKEYNANLAESLKLLDAIQKEKGLSDEQMDAAYDLVNKMAHEALLGKYSRETVELALKALNHDADMQNASAEGEVRGRNAKIEEQLRKPKKNDGMAQLASGGSAGVAAKKERIPSVFEEAAMAR